MLLKTNYLATPLRASPLLLCNVVLTAGHFDMPSERDNEAFLRADRGTELGDWLLMSAGLSDGVATRARRHV
jgi:hypothetical protein